MDISEMLTSLNLDKNNLKLKAELKSFLDSQNVDSLLDFVNSSNLNIQIIALERLISLNSILSTIDLSIYFKSLSTFHKSVYPLLLCFINSHSKNTKHANELAAALDSENISLLLSNEENFQLGLDLLSNTVCNCEKITATVCISIIEV